MISNSEVVQRAERDLESDSAAKRATSKETQINSNHWLEENLEFLGKALQTTFEGEPKGTCTKFDNETKTWCGKKEKLIEFFQTNTCFLINLFLFVYSQIFNSEFY